MRNNTVFVFLTDYIWPRCFNVIAKLYQINVFTSHLFPYGILFSDYIYQFSFYVPNSKTNKSKMENPTAIHCNK